MLTKLFIKQNNQIPIQQSKKITQPKNYIQEFRIFNCKTKTKHLQKDSAKTNKMQKQTRNKSIQKQAKKNQQIKLTFSKICCKQIDQSNSLKGTLQNKRSKMNRTNNRKLFVKQKLQKSQMQKYNFQTINFQDLKNIHHKYPQKNQNTLLFLKTEPEAQIKKQTKQNKIYNKMFKIKKKKLLNQYKQNLSKSEQKTFDNSFSFYRYQQKLKKQQLQDDVSLSHNRISHLKEIKNFLCQKNANETNIDQNLKYFKNNEEQTKQIENDKQNQLNRKQKKDELNDNKTSSLLSHQVISINRNMKLLKSIQNVNKKLLDQERKKLSLNFILYQKSLNY